ncbi:phosphatase PAP2 family protein [Halosquirtibacter xylanolyticus]|uniref:phosphatase PAP2 family protein n=1 Tax=Halosquirtibacter xylanolyticus TaxID=3374599 RepID=UPI0037482968|nr:phosphatase PAP2 family protein [Prolixibacteraceae bacterium]
MWLIEALKELDSQLLLYFNGNHSTLWDYVMFTYTYKITWVLFYGILAYHLYKHFGKQMWIIIPMIALTILVTDQTCNLFKYGFARPRPGHDPVIGSLVNIFYKKGGRFGFVSAHAANSFALSILIYKYVKNKTFLYYMLIWSAIVSFSRVYLGVHYPGDVICGGLLGVFYGWLIYRVTLVIEKYVPFMNGRSFSRSSMSNQELKPVFSALRWMLGLPIFIVLCYVINDLL